MEFRTGAPTSAGEVAHCAMRSPSRQPNFLPPARAGGGSILEAEADFERHLPMRDLSILNFATRFNDLEPVHVADGVRRLGDGIFYRCIDAFWRSAGEREVLVDVIGHRRSS